MAFANVLFYWSTCYLLLLLLLLLLRLPEAHSKCPPSFPCRNFSLEFPFADSKDRECGLFPVQNCDSQYGYPTVRIGTGDSPRSTYFILDRKPENRLLVHDFILQTLLTNGSCLALSDVSLISSPSVSFTFSPNLTVFQCLKGSYGEETEFFKKYDKKECEPLTVYYNGGSAATGEIRSVPYGCAAARLPKSGHESGGLIAQVSATFVVEWSVSEACLKCYKGGGKCLTDDQNEFYCKQDKSWWKLIIILSISGAGVLMLLLITYIIWLRKKNSSKGYLRSTKKSSSKSDIEGGIFYFGIPVFSYAELEEATNNFDPCEELGDGGFGTVYHGKLSDGREVAIKRMYERNFKRVEQFLNEIKILTGLRHPNLVSLHGCTSRTSRELLLVYEYIPNGTVFDHLHGERAKEAPLPWPIRMKIAVETATALAYLHRSDIIHRDVKTKNILLDTNYSIKVADFGLSRLFPENVTHISTAPQGTPGYVDPEYHQFYKLTDKSDVYSFGVVLIELISSLLAVDVNRHRHEINLANLALDRIQRCLFDELIDPSLGYGSDPEVTRMTTMVAELAFRCLQVDRNLRPAMDEVVDFLNDIHDCKFEQRKQGNGNHMISPSPETDDVFMLKNRNFHSSPMAVTDAWISTSASAATSFTG